MATVDQVRKRIVLEEADYAALDGLVDAGVKAGLIRSGRGRSSSLRAKGEAKGKVRITAELPPSPAAHASPGAQSRRG